jgi:ABC-type multidrug transport system fused ATPase/permease subunit
VAQLQVPLLDAGRRRLLGLLVANGLLQAVAIAGSAWGAQQAFDIWVLGAAPTSAVGGVPAGLAWPLLLLVCSALVAALRLHERVAAERLGQSYVAAVRVALFDRLGRLPARAIRSRSRGGHLLRFVGDLTALRHWVSLGLSRLTVAGVALIMTLVALTAISTLVAAGTGLALALAVGGALALGPGIRRAVRDARRRRARLAGNIDEKIAAMDTLQVFGQLKRERSRLARQSRCLAEAMVDRARWLGRLRALTEAGSGLATLAILGAGALAVRQGDATPGAVIAGLTVLGLAMPLLRDLSRVHEYWHGYRVARDNLERVMDDRVQGPELRRGRRRLPDGPGELRVEGLFLGDSLLSVDLEARGGERVLVVGGNGAGKSTLLALIARLLDPEQGCIRIDGQDVARCRLNAVRRVVGLASAELPLLRGTLERNLRYRCPEASADELARVIQLAGVQPLLDRLPGGLQAQVVEGGANLSLGERQRVGLARALLGGPRVLLLDEVDAHLDAEGHAALERVLASFEGTVVMVSHDPRRAAAADRIWHLEHGWVVADGPPEALLRPGRSTHRRLAAGGPRAVA